MRIAAALLIVSLGGFAVMVLEIIGARYLAKDFGSAFYVWVSQIGVILAALALGYALGGALADKIGRLAWLAWLLVPAGVFTFLIPIFAPPLVNAIIQRHPADIPISALWQKLDPALGSTLVFFLPCAVLAMLSPYLIRVAARRLTHVGRTSGIIYAASTVGSIAGVFVSGYVLIEQMTITNIFHATGILTALLGVLCCLADRWFPPEKASDQPASRALAR
jgi:MFS family permease